MVLLLQIDGSLPKHFPSHERRLYIFSCKRNTCKRKEGSVRAIRAVRTSTISQSKAEQTDDTAKKAEERATEKPFLNLGETLFGSRLRTPEAGAASLFSNSSKAAFNPFATTASKPSGPSSFTTTSAKDLPATFAEKASISEAQPTQKPSDREVFHEAWPPASEFPSPFLVYQLDAELETLQVQPAPHTPPETIIEVDDPAKGVNSKEDKMLFESTLDSTFQKFADRLAQNPEQVLRYEFGGSPLLYSKEDSVGRAFSNSQHVSSKVKTVTQGPTPCPNCGRKRVFELQLTPHAIVELEGDNIDLNGMDWGTIILAVCSEDCLPKDYVAGSVSYLDEWIGVQWEDLGKQKS